MARKNRTVILSNCGAAFIPIDGYGLQLFGAFSMDHHYCCQSKIQQKETKS